MVKLDTAAAQLLKIGITQFEVDAKNYEPEATRVRRPDRVEAMRELHNRSKAAG